MSDEPLESQNTFEPERWEVAVEDAAQVVALALDRTLALLDALSDLWHRRPLLTSALLAAVAGALVGTIVAGRRRRRPAPSPQEGRAAILAQAAAVAQAAAERLARSSPRAVGAPAREVGNGFARVAARPRGFASLGGRRVRQAADLLPLALTVLRNPLVRHLLWRLAVRSLRSR